jgi:hypothetical protein
MQQREVAFFLQSMRGAQPIVVLAFLMIGRGMTIEELRTVTGMDDDALRSAVKGLEAKELLHKQVGRHGKQTWLPAGDSFLGQLLGQNPEIPDSAGGSSSNQLSFPTIEPEEEEETDSGFSGICLRACDEVGIREPKRSKISKLVHVTPEMIRAHCRQAAAEGMSLGTAIHRIEYNWPYEKKYLADDPEQADRDKYLNGVYSDYLEH